MDLYLPTHEPVRLAKAPVALWMRVALIGVVLGAAALGCALTTDNRDYTARHLAAVLSSAL